MHRISLAFALFFNLECHHSFGNIQEVKGHPDLVFLKEKVAVFVDGCFWHGHDCRNTRPEAIFKKPLFVLREQFCFYNRLNERNLSRRSW